MRRALWLLVPAMMLVSCAAARTKKLACHSVEAEGLPDGSAFIWWQVEGDYESASLKVRSDDRSVPTIHERISRGRPFFRLPELPDGRYEVSVSFSNESETANNMQWFVIETDRDKIGLNPLDRSDFPGVESLGIDTLLALPAWTAGDQDAELPEDLLRRKRNELRSVGIAVSGIYVGASFSIRNQQEIDVILKNREIILADSDTGILPQALGAKALMVLDLRIPRGGTEAQIMVSLYDLVSSRVGRDRAPLKVFEAYQELDGYALDEKDQSRALVEALARCFEEMSKDRRVVPYARAVNVIDNRLLQKAAKRKELDRLLGIELSEDASAVESFLFPDWSDASEPKTAPPPDPRKNG